MEVMGQLNISGKRICYALRMEFLVDIVGGGLAGSEAALQLAQRGINVRLHEMRPHLQTPVHQSDNCAELVCSNSLKSMKEESAAGMLKYELKELGSILLRIAFECQVPAGNALAVDREKFSERVTEEVLNQKNIEVIRHEVQDISFDSNATILASGPLTSESLARRIIEITGSESLAFYDAAAPIVLADSLDYEKLFSQDRYESQGDGDYLNAAFSKTEYESFIAELISAKRVVAKDFETADLFQACQPIEEIARKGVDAPRYGALKPVGLTDPRTGHRPWAAVQLRAENQHKSSYNLVGFQTNLSFSEQKRVFRMIPGLDQAEFVRYGVMHRNTFIDAPHILSSDLRVDTHKELPLYIAGQLGGTEGYCEAIMSGLWTALNVYSMLQKRTLDPLPDTSVFGALLSYATNPETLHYQPMHVNFGIIPPLENRVRNKQERYACYAERARHAMQKYKDEHAFLFEGLC